MTLFDECRVALSADFDVLKDQREKDAIDLLHEFPFSKGNVIWADLKYSDYEDIKVLISEINKKDEAFVFADDIHIPVFRSRLGLITENIYDVVALSPKLFIFNKHIIMQPLFPTGIIRVGKKHQ